MKRFSLLLLTTLLAACSDIADLTGPTAKKLDGPSLTVTPTGVTATVTACFNQFAQVTVTWTVVDPDVTWVTFGGYDHTTGALLYAGDTGSSRIMEYPAGYGGTNVPYGDVDIRVFNWSPVGAEPGKLLPSDPAVVILSVDHKSCPKKNASNGHANDHSAVS